MIVAAGLALALAPASGASAACVPTPVAVACADAGPDGASYQITGQGTFFGQIDLSGGFASSDLCAADTCLSNLTGGGPDGIHGAGTIAAAATCTNYNYGYEPGADPPRAGFSSC